MRPIVGMLAAIAAVILLAQPASAQRGGPSEPKMSEKEKAAIAEKRQRAKDIDEAYKATLKNMPDKQEKADPWGNLRGK